MTVEEEQQILVFPNFSLYPSVFGIAIVSRQDPAVCSMLRDALVSTQLQAALVWQSRSREHPSSNCGSLIGLADKRLHQTYSTAPEKLRVECFLLSFIAMPPVNRSELSGPCLSLAG